jgi:hypothetical protein
VSIRVQLGVFSWCARTASHDGCTHAVCLCTWCVRINVHAHSNCETHSYVACMQSLQHHMLVLHILNPHADIKTTCSCSRCDLGVMGRRSVCKLLYVKIMNVHVPRPRVTHRIETLLIRSYARGVSSSEAATAVHIVFSVCHCKYGCGVPCSFPMSSTALCGMCAQNAYMS